MNCLQVRQLLDDLSRDRLPAALAARVRQHVADCTDCRVYQQRGARLQRLLALTRYEQPPPAYFAGVVGEFHRRRAARARRRHWWTDVAEIFGGDHQLAASYALAGAAALALAFGAYWLGPRLTTRPTPAAAVPATPTAGVVVRFVSPPASPVVAVEPLVLPATTAVAAAYAVPETPAHPPAPETPAPAHATRYVLDNLPVVPVSYDAARADF